MSLKSYILNGKEQVSLFYASQKLHAYFKNAPQDFRTCYTEGEAWGRHFRPIDPKPCSPETALGIAATCVVLGLLMVAAAAYLNGHPLKNPMAISQMFIIGGVIMGCSVPCLLGAGVAWIVNEVKKSAQIEQEHFLKSTIINKTQIDTVVNEIADTLVKKQAPPGFISVIRGDL